ncbi:hypothetical protein RND81_03G051100 [Saponaria officinalis]|uniref:CCHC-type domain-containing protein n=1 Tax=Saponaria officinalis TaxID=3572 RepID=A0AAW1M4R2_SAPOF
MCCLRIRLNLLFRLILRLPLPLLLLLSPTKKEIKKFEKDNKTARSHLLNHMTNTLVDLFMIHKSAKVIWGSLESKYGSDDAGKKNMLLVNGLIHIYENLCADVVNEGMELCDVFLANVLFEKFPPSCVKVNLIESSGPSYVGPSNAAKFKAKGNTKGGPGQAKNQVPKIQKPAGTLVCYACGKSGHKAYQCTQKKTDEANVAETDDIIAAVIVEANLVGNVAEWILDTGASRHFCAHKGLFAEFEEVADGECIYMGNSSSAMITGKGKIFLKLTSGKTLALNNVLYVPTLRRNLVSGALLNKAGMKLVFEADKLVMSRNGEFVGKGYLSGGLFILNTDFVSNNNVT